MDPLKLARCIWASVQVQSTWPDIRHSLDTKESPVPYVGLGLADITVKPHFEFGNQEVLSTLLQISMDLSAFSRRSSVIDKACKVGFE